MSIPKVHRPFVDTSHPNFWDYTVNGSSALSAQEVRAAPGAGLRIVLTDFIFSATGTANTFKLIDGSTDIVELIYVAADDNFGYSFQTPIRLTANTALNVTTSGATAHSVTVSGFVEEA